MFCIKCGVENSNEAKFCHACGQAVDETTNSIPTTPKYAGFWQRFAASFIDGLIVTLFSIPAFIAMAVGANAGKATEAISTLFGYLLVYIISAIYFSKMESGEHRATFGKRWLGIQVSDLEGNRISAGRAFGRWAAHFLSYITLYIGFIMQPFTERKQALHDMVSGTVVMDTGENKNSSGIIIGVVVSIIVGVAIIGILAAIAIPAYQDYVTRAKTAEAYTQAEIASRAVEMYYLKTGKLPQSLDEAGYQFEPSLNIAEIKVDPKNAIVSVLFSAKAGGILPTKHLILTPSEEGKTIIWHCSSDGIPARVLPPPCRQ